MSANDKQSPIIDDGDIEDDWEDVDEEAFFEEEEEEQLFEEEEEDEDEDDDGSEKKKKQAPANPRLVRFFPANHHKAESPAATAPAAGPVFRRDTTSKVCFLFDVANLGASAKRSLAMPLSVLARNLPAMMALAAAPAGTTVLDEELFCCRRAVGVDAQVDASDQGRGAMSNLHFLMQKFCGIELDLFSSKGKAPSSSGSQVQRAVDVSLACHLLDLSGVIVPPPSAAAAASAPSSSTEERHVIVFSSDSDLEPAIAMATSRNPNLKLSVVCDKHSTSRVYQQFLEKRGCKVVDLSLLAARAASPSSPVAASASSASPASPDSSSAASSPFFINNYNHNTAFTAPRVVVEHQRRGTAQSVADWLVDLKKKLVEVQPIEPQQKQGGGGNDDDDDQQQQQQQQVFFNIILKINNDDTLTDGDLVQLLEWTKQKENQPLLKHVTQLWLDHDANILKGKKGEQTLVSLCCAVDGEGGFPAMRELHISHTPLSIEAFHRLALTAGAYDSAARTMSSRTKNIPGIPPAPTQTFYINANNTPAAEDVEASTDGFKVVSSKNAKTMKLVVGPGLGASVNARFVGHYQERAQERFENRGRGGRGGRGRGGRGGAAAAAAAAAADAGVADGAEASAPADAAPATRGRGFGGRGARQAKRFFGDSKHDVPSDEDFTMEEMLEPGFFAAAAAGRSAAAGEARGGRGRGRGGNRGGGRGRGGGERGRGNRGGGGGRGRGCFNCGGDHIARDCPQAPQPRGGRGANRGERGRGSRGGRGRGGNNNNNNNNNNNTRIDFDEPNLNHHEHHHRGRGGRGRGAF